jgi:hypothetical protein
VPVASNRSLIFAQSVSELLAEIEASGGQYRDSHTSVIDDNGTLLVLLTIIYDDETSDHAGAPQRDTFDAVCGPVTTARYVSIGPEPAPRAEMPAPADVLLLDLG